MSSKKKSNTATAPPECKFVPDTGAAGNHRLIVVTGGKPEEITFQEPFDADDLYAFMSDHFDGLYNTGVLEEVLKFIYPRLGKCNQAFTNFCDALEHDDKKRFSALLSLVSGKKDIETAYDLHKPEEDQKARLALYTQHWQTKRNRHEACIRQDPTAFLELYGGGEQYEKDDEWLVAGDADDGGKDISPSFYRRYDALPDAEFYSVFTGTFTATDIVASREAFKDRARALVNSGGSDATEKSDSETVSKPDVKSDVKEPPKPRRISPVVSETPKPDVKSDIKEPSTTHKANPAVASTAASTSDSKPVSKPAIKSDVKEPSTKRKASPATAAASTSVDSVKPSSSKRQKLSKQTLAMIDNVLDSVFS